LADIERGDPLSTAFAAHRRDGRRR
jgi:hypothetical protein